MNNTIHEIHGKTYLFGICVSEYERQVIVRQYKKGLFSLLDHIPECTIGYHATYFIRYPSVAFGPDEQLHTEMECIMKQDPPVVILYCYLFYFIMNLLCFVLMLKEGISFIMNYLPVTTFINAPVVYSICTSISIWTSTICISPV